MRQQGDQHHHKVFACPQPVEDRPCGLDKRLVAHVAFVAVFFETVHADVSLTNLSPCGTSRIGAKHGLWVHWHSPGLVSEQNQIVPEDPVLSKYIPHHDSVGSYPSKRSVFENLVSYGIVTITNPKKTAMKVQPGIAG
jgi:hypothetical protein